MTGSSLWLFLGAVAGGSAVGLGAFGAHALRERLAESALATWQTAVTYQFTHALALLAVAILLRIGLGAERPLTIAAAGFVIGTVLFSGSLYLLALGGPRWLGPITPVGGLAFIVGWVALAVAAVRAGPAA
jgi:uncharacterized membrane protein YgdD (TMEM256/DUF423 family)